MCSLVELPEELIVAIVHNLSSDTPSLLNLCLSGNHILLAIARPLTWKKVTFHVDFGEWADGIGWWSTHSISLFTADQKRAGSVVSARIKFSGIYYYNPLIMEPLQESLKKLSNLTHAYLCFFEASSGETDEEILSPLELVLQSLPRLKNIYVDAYAAGKEFFPPVELPQLKSLVTRYCSLTAGSWTSAQNLEVIELCEGSGEDYYWRNIHRSDSFRSYMGPGDENDMGIRYLLNETRLQAGYFKRLRRLHVISDLKRERKAFRRRRQRINAITRFFRQCPNSFIALEELILDLPIGPSEYEDILHCMAVPSLKRVMIKPEEFSLYHIQTTFGPSQSARWENLSSLEELWLPLEGREDEIGIIQPSLSKLKNLKRLYFAESREYDMAEAVTIHLGAQLPLLEVVSWDYCCCFRIFRDQEGVVESVSKQEYQKPKWQTFAPAP